MSGIVAQKTGCNPEAIAPTNRNVYLSLTLIKSVHALERNLQIQNQTIPAQNRRFIKATIRCRL